jgi:hypothetical protein
MTDPPDQPLPPPSEPDAVGEMARSAEDVAPKSLQGCSPILLIGILAIISIIVIGAVAIGPRNLFSDDDPSPSSSPSTSPSASASPSESTSPSETPSDSPSEPPPGGRYKPPAEADLPPGARLYRGTSGNFLGCITCDGESRFLSIAFPGVSVGNAAQMEFVWKKTGQFVEFGANASRPNKGRYAYNLFANGTTYLAGCSMEIGQTSCRQQRPHDVAKGDRIVIIASEAGTMVNGQVASTGNFRVDWWFVFVPAA